MMGFGVARMMTTAEGRRLVTTLQRIMESQKMPVEQALSESVDFMEKLEQLAQRTGKTIKEVADEALAAYEADL